MSAELYNLVFAQEITCYFSLHLFLVVQKD